MSKQSELDRWCVAFLDGDMSAGQFKRAITDWHQQEIAKARIDEVKKARDDYTTRVPDVFDRDIYQVKYFQYRNEELTAELSQTLKKES